MSAGSGGSSVAEVNVHSSSWLKSSEKVKIVKAAVDLLLLFFLNNRRLLLQKKSLLLLLLFVVMVFVAMLANIFGSSKVIVGERVVLQLKSV